MRRSAQLAALGLLVALTCAAKPFPEAPSSYVYNEGVIPQSDASALSLRLADVERKSGHQFVVALFQSLDGESLEDYTNRLFRTWKIGQAKTDDGLLFALFLKEHKWRVEVGYGLEGTITDLEAAEFGRAGVPYYQSGDFAGGVRVVVQGLADRLEGLPGARRPPPPSGPPGNPFDEPTLWIVVIFIVWFLLQTWARRRTIGRRGYDSRFGGWWGGSDSGGWGGSGWGGSGGGWGGGGGGWGGGGFSGGGGS